LCRTHTLLVLIIDECIDSLAGNKWFSKLDANSAYYQVKMKEEDKPKTAFITKYGLFQFNRMSFGLCCQWSSNSG
jgi:hypothetical protein